MSEQTSPEKNISTRIRFLQIRNAVCPSSSLDLREGKFGGCPRSPASLFGDSALVSSGNIVSKLRIHSKIFPFGACADGEAGDASCTNVA